MKKYFDSLLRMIFVSIALFIILFTDNDLTLAQATTEDFENVADQGVQTSPFTTTNGITFTTANGTLHVIDDGFGNFVLQVIGIGFGAPELTITVGSSDFDLTSLFVDAGPSSLDVSVDAQDSSDASVATSGPSANPESITAFNSSTVDHSNGGITTIAIRQIYINGTPDFEGFAIDNIVFSGGGGGGGGGGNTPPDIANLDGDEITFTEKINIFGVFLDENSDLSVTDGDSTDFDSGVLNVSIVNNQNMVEDWLLFDEIGSISLDGIFSSDNVRVSGIIVGTLGSDITAGNTLTVNLNANANPANITTLLEAVLYLNINPFDPSTLTRTVRVTLTDGDGGTSSDNDITVNVNSVNDPPDIFSITSLNPDFNSGDPAKSLFNGAIVTTVEIGQNITAFTVQVTNVKDSSNEMLKVDGSNIVLNAGTGTTTHFSYSVTMVGEIATITFTGGSVSEVDMAGIIDGIMYQNTKPTPTVGDRVVKIKSLTDDGGTANSGIDTNTLLNISSTVSIILVNQAPIAASYSVNSYNATISIQKTTLISLATDNNISDLSIIGVNKPINGSVNIVNTDIVFTKNSSTFYGNAFFEYTLSDGTYTGTGTVTVNFMPNHPPVAMEDIFYDKLEDHVVIINKMDLLMNDSDEDIDDNDLLDITSVDTFVGGEAILSGNNITFTPTLNFNGEASFQYTVTDTKSNSKGTVKINIKPVNDIPKADNQLISVSERSTNNEIKLSGTDDDKDPLTYKLRFFSRKCG